MKGKAYTIISFLLGVGTLAFMVYKIGYTTIWQNILQTGIWFIPVIATWLLIYVLNALAFREIIYERDEPQTRVSFFTVLKITIAGYAINNITPFIALGGEPYRVLQLRKQVSGPKAASSVLLYYIMHVFSHIVFWMVSIALILIFLKPGAVVTMGCLAVFALFYFAIYWIFRQYKKGLLLVTFKTMSRLPFLARRINNFTVRKGESLTEIDQHIRELFSQRRATFYASLFYEFAGRVVGCLEIYFIALALQVNIGPVDSFIISAGSSLFANIIFFTPMQLGSREGGFVLALGSIGFAASAGLFISLATRVRELVWTLIGLLIIPLKPIRRP
jgi:uncharacterized membrane protein YbhN (UPF0104 family)